VSLRSGSRGARGAGLIRDGITPRPRVARKSREEGLSSGKKRNYGREKEFPALRSRTCGYRVFGERSRGCLERGGTEKLRGKRKHSTARPLRRALEDRGTGEHPPSCRKARFAKRQVGIRGPFLLFFYSWGGVTR